MVRNLPQYLVRRSWILNAVLLLTCAVESTRAQTYVGVASGAFQNSYSEQDRDEWCWAASLQMIYSYHGLNVPQSEIVRRSYGVQDASGTLPNWAGSFQLITANLNGQGVDDNGTAYTVKSSLGFGAPPPQVLVHELSQQRPLLLAYRPSPTGGHAVVVTGASYIGSQSAPTITSIIVRDPWPSDANKARDGRVEYSGAQMAAVMTNYWVVRVSSSNNGGNNGPVPPNPPASTTVEVSIAPMSVGKVDAEVTVSMDGQVVGSLSNMTGPYDVQIADVSLGTHTIDLHVQEYAFRPDGTTVPLTQLSKQVVVNVRPGSKYRVVGGAGGGIALVGN
jgi:hypothetical protein